MAAATSFADASLQTTFPLFVNSAALADCPISDRPARRRQYRFTVNTAEGSHSGASYSGRSVRATLPMRGATGASESLGARALRLDTTLPD